MKTELHLDVQTSLVNFNNDLTEQYLGLLDIQVLPYVNLNESNEMVLKGLANQFKFSDGHSPYAPSQANPYRLYALFKHRNAYHICPVHKSQPTCLNPVTVVDDVIELSTRSIGGVVYAHQLEQLLEQEYVAGIIRVL